MQNSKINYIVLCISNLLWLGKFKNSPHRVSNPRPPGVQHSALTTTLPRPPTSQRVVLSKLLSLSSNGLFFIRNKEKHVAPLQSRSHISVSHYVFIAVWNKRRIVQNSDKRGKKFFAEDRLKIIVLSHYNPQGSLCTLRESKIGIYGL
jgi:hypothetical protein